MSDGLFAELCAIETEADNCHLLWSILPDIQSSLFELFGVTTSFGPCFPTSVVIYYSAQTNTTPNDEITTWLSGYLAGRFPDFVFPIEGL